MINHWPDAAGDFVTQQLLNISILFENICFTEHKKCGE